MFRSVWFGLFVVTVSACVRQRPFQDPAYAGLPRINLLMVHHGGIAHSRVERDVRYEVEAFLADNRIAVAGGPYDEGVADFSLDLVDTGIAPGAEQRGFVTSPTALSSNGPTLGAFGGVPENNAADSWPGDDARILDAMVYMRRAHRDETVLVGHVRGIVGPDVVSSAKMAEVLAVLIRRGMSKQQEPSNPEGSSL